MRGPEAFYPQNVTEVRALCPSLAIRPTLSSAGAIMPEGLPWFRADTNMPTNDKIIDLVGSGTRGKGAAFVYVCSIATSVGNGSDGVIRRGQLPFIHGTAADAKLLVEYGLWDEVEGIGWRIHNYGTRQVVGAMQQAIENELRETRAEAGRQGAAKRWASQ